MSEPGEDRTEKQRQVIGSLFPELVRQYGRQDAGEVAEKLLRTTAAIPANASRAYVRAVLHNVRIDITRQDRARKRAEGRFAEDFGRPEGQEDLDQGTRALPLGRQKYGRPFRQPVPEARAEAKDLLSRVPKQDVALVKGALSGQTVRELEEATGVSKSSVDRKIKQALQQVVRLADSTPSEVGKTFHRAGQFSFMTVGTNASPHPSKRVRRPNHAMTVSVEELAGALGVAPTTVLELVKAGALDELILAEPLEHQELVFHEAAWAFAELLNELRAHYADNPAEIATEGRGIVDALRPQLVDLWRRAREGETASIAAVVKQPDGTERTIPLHFLARALRRVKRSAAPVLK